MKSFAHIPLGGLFRWNRRQRKKLRPGEFQELGFTLKLQFSPPLDDNAANPFWEALIAHIESLGCAPASVGACPWPSWRASSAPPAGAR